MQAIHSFKNLLLPCLIFFGFFSGIRAEATFDDSFAQATTSYQRGDFQTAAVKFYACSKMTPASLEAHYYLGNSYVHLNRMNDAIREYQAVIKLAPDSPYAEYSAQAIAEFPVSITKQLQSPLPKQTLVQKPSALEQGGQRVVETVNAQTDATEKALQQEMDAKVKIIMTEAARRAKAVEEEKKEQVAANQSERRKGYVPDNSGLDAEFQKRMDAINQDARKRADSVKNEYKMRMQAIQDSAVNTNTAYTRAAEKGTIRHSALQSSLFVHNYEIEAEPSGNPVPLAGSPMSLSPKKK